MSTWGSRKRDERGAAVVETALCICFIVIPLVFATISYAYMFSFRQSLSQAAAEGARAAAIAPVGVTQANAQTVATAAVNSALSGIADGVQCNDGKLTCTFVWKTSGCGTDGAGVALKCLAVTLTYPYRSNPLIPAPGLGFVLPDNIGYTATAQVG